MAIEAALGGGQYTATLTANASANTKGAWTELLASTSEAAKAIWVSVIVPNGSGPFLIDIGTGGAGAESAVISNIPYAGGTATVLNVSSPGLYIPISIASGTRIAARCQSATGGLTVQIAVYIVGGSNSATVATYGADTATSGGTTVDPGATANTKGAYSEITASTSADIDTLVVAITGRANAAPASALFTMDVATGAAASESVVLPDLTFSSNSSADSWSPNVWYFPVEIASGTRIAARAASQDNNSVDRLFDVIVFGVTGGQPSGGGGASAYTFIG